jgi:hypothetical protein
MSRVGKYKLVINNDYSKIIGISGFTSVLGFFTNLIMPLKLGIGVFGEYRYITTILGFAGLLHLGYLDGFYLISLGKNVTTKFSVGYLSVLVLVMFCLIFVILKYIGVDFFISPALMFLLFLTSAYINYLVICYNIYRSFVIPLMIQAIMALVFLVAISNSYMAKLVVADINLSVLILLILQLILLYFWWGKTTSSRLMEFRIGKLADIKDYHSKGIKTLFIGLTIILILGIDKVILIRYLTKENFGIYCFSNSIIVSLLGLSFSVSNRFLGDLYKINSSNYGNKYNLLVRNISVFTVALIILSSLISNFHCILGATQLNLYLSFFTPACGVFSFLFIIQLLHSNIAKVFNIEIEFVVFYLILVVLICVLLYFLNHNIPDFLLIYSGVLCFSVLIFDRVVLEKQTGFGLSKSNKIIVFFPVIIELLIRVIVSF